MPKFQTVTYKYKCLEFLCNKIIRGDKWTAHCKNCHIVKFNTGEEVKRHIVEVIHGDGPWQKTGKPVEVLTQKSESSAESASSAKDKQETSTVTATQVVAQIELAQDLVEVAAESSSLDLIAGDQKESVVCTETADHDPCTSTDVHIAREMSETQLHDNENDPSRYAGKRLNSQTITHLIKLGPSQPTAEIIEKHAFSGRKFSTTWFTAKLPDGSEKCRKWLSYSVTTHRAYCIYCIMFAGPKASELWTNNGFCDTDHGARDISRHELNPEHVNAEKAVIRWIRGGGDRIDNKLAAVHNVLVEQNRHIVRCMIDCAKYLATEMMAFQGHS
jgi:hypothetical protein